MMFFLQIIGFLFSGLATGLLLSVPIGPANLLCLERTLKSGVIAGFMTGIGATFGDFIFVIATLTGFIAIGDIDIEQSSTLKYIGSIVLLCFGTLSFIKGYKQYYHKNASQLLSEVFKHKQQNSCVIKQKLSIFSGFISSFILTVTNPMTPIGVISAVTAVGLGSGILDDISVLSVVSFVCGILIGSIGWWFSLSMIAQKFAKSLVSKSLSIVNYIAGIFMVCLSVYILTI